MGRGCRACQGASGFLRRAFAQRPRHGRRRLQTHRFVPCGLDLCHQDARSRRYAVGGPADGLRGLRSSHRRLCPGWGWHAAPQHEEHSPSARAAASADPQPVSSAAPASSSASATQPKAAPVAAPTPSAPKPVTAKPAAPTPAPKPASPAPKSSDLGKAPWLRSDNPAGAPATGKLPTEPAPRAPERSAAPKSQPAASSAPWESERVPYDDAMVGGFAADAGGDDLPPFDVPAAAPASKPAVTAPKEEDAPAAPWESNPAPAAPSATRAQPRASRRPRTRPKPSSAASSARPPSSNRWSSCAGGYTAQEEGSMSGRI